ncbi:MAG: membrane dipeptidase [bacterium]|nr:membrane dipeptidase [bacterium]
MLCRVGLHCAALVAVFALLLPAGATAAPCGQPGQRACCIGEGVACVDGAREVPGCAGDCACGNSIFSSSGTCQAITPCGGAGQRACCAFFLEGSACADGLVEVPFCNGNCYCGGTATGAIAASGTCIQPSPCGGVGQRACCDGLSEAPACQDGLTKVPGCTGDCFCGGPLATGQHAVHMCGRMEPIDEPTTDSTPASLADYRSRDDRPACPLLGYADLHVHMMAHLAHGGAVLVGKPYDEAGGVNAALRHDFATDLDIVNANGSERPAPLFCPAWLPDCGAKLFHGDHLLIDDVVGQGTQDGTTSNLGAPLFNGWPTARSTTHQQTYYRWLERAWRGGLRLMSMLAVTNEALCKGSKRLRQVDCNDSMAPIDAQLALARDFEAFVDAESGGPGQGWFRIVTTPAEARQEIAAGNLAVVLGIEVDNLFNCKFGQCDEAYVEERLDHYYDLGVRHVFPVHNFDNGFGSPATWQDAIHVGNRVSEGRWWEAEECAPQGYRFHLDFALAGILNLLGFGNFDLPAPYPQTATCNKLGLSPLGKTFVGMLMDRGMIIDVDHMSNHSLDETLTLAEARFPKYPVVASHVQFFDLNASSIRHERMRTLAQLRRIRSVGGMIAAMTKDDVQDTDKRGEQHSLPYGVVPNDCRHSSKTFAQALQYSVDVMEGPVALGSDFNGIAGHFGPRFGHEACANDGNERSAQLRANRRVSYPFALAGFGTFDRQVTGQRTFDYNVDGLAHIGLLPDMVEDLKVMGVPEQYTTALFQSAEAFIHVWERARGQTVPAALCTPGRSADDLQCHQTRTAKRQPRFAPRPITISDRFGTATALVKNVRTLCNAADTGLGIATDAGAHLLCHDTKEPKKQTPALSRLALRDAFGDIALTPVKPLRACFPAEVDGTAATAPLEAYRCYRARTSAGTTPFTPRAVTIRDAFGSRTGMLSKPTELCLPAGVDGGAAGDPGRALVCYRVDNAGRPFASRNLTAVTQLGAQSLTARPLLPILCVPARVL